MDGRNQASSLPDQESKTSSRLLVRDDDDDQTCHNMLISPPPLIIYYTKTKLLHPGLVNAPSLALPCPDRTTSSEFSGER